MCVVQGRLGNRCHGVGDSEVWAVVSWRMLNPAIGARKTEGGAGFEERGMVVCFIGE